MCRLSRLRLNEDRKSCMSHLSRLERESESQQTQIVQNSKIKAGNTHAACATGIFLGKCACRWGQGHFTRFYRGAAGKRERPATCLQYIENKNMEGNRSVEDSKPYQVFAGDVNTKNCRGGRGGNFSLETERFRMGFRVLRKELLKRICKM